MDSPPSNSDCSGEDAHKYYHSEILPNGYQDIYGSWELIQTTGGITGYGFGTKDLSIRMCPFGIFRLYKKGIEINHAKMEFISTNADNISVNFQFDKQDTVIGLAAPTYIFVPKNDSLWFKSPCCDRYDYLFKRK